MGGGRHRRAPAPGHGTGTRHRDTPPPAAGLHRPGPRLSRPSSLPSAAPRANKMMQSSALAAEGAVKGLPEILGVPVQRKDAFLFSLLRSLPQRRPRAGGAAPCGRAGASAPVRSRSALSVRFPQRAAPFTATKMRRVREGERCPGAGGSRSDAGPAPTGRTARLRLGVCEREFECERE